MNDFVLYAIVGLLLVKAYLHYEYIDRYRSPKGEIEKYLKYFYVATPFYISQGPFEDKHQKNKSQLIIWLSFLSMGGIAFLFIMLLLFS
ncbi:hypothetical protein GCM10011506_33190 [Marivirga lumbricoides]|uniref:Uncharacterized protein n=1 Tax=Marivirga lumbricoides TaxID=1046115 RepID=A0ABQ1MXP1_9BACT|nr:hypothetical protein GCM10011506_33190 [Marivirga lumbricoides]